MENTKSKMNNLTLDEFKKYYKEGDKVEYSIDHPISISTDVVMSNGQLMQITSSSLSCSGIIDHFDGENLYVAFFFDNCEEIHYSKVILSDEVKKTLNRDNIINKLIK